jgi:hypothetical protein
MRRDGDRLEMIGRFFFPTFPLLGGQSQDEDFEARMRITFPGHVSSTNGQLDGNTVTWNLRPSTLEFVQATVDVDGGASGPAGWQLGAGVALAVVLVGGIGVLWLRRRRRPALAGAGSGGAYGPSPHPVGSGAGPQSDQLWAPPPGAGPGAQSGQAGVPGPRSDQLWAPSPGAGPGAQSGQAGVPGPQSGEAWATPGAGPATGRPEDWIWARPESGERPGLGTAPAWPGRAPADPRSPDVPRPPAPDEPAGPGR